MGIRLSSQYTVQLLRAMYQTKRITRLIINDQAGAVVSAELIVLVTIVLIGMVVATSSTRDAIVGELSDLSGAVQDSNQSFSYNGIFGNSSSLAGSQFGDSLDTSDSVEDPIGEADNCIVFDTPPRSEFFDLILINASFENDVDPANALRQFGGGPSAFLFNAADVAGWQTTASDQQIEIWQSGFQGVSSQSGDYHAELNANIPSQLFQEFDVLPGDVVEYTISHRGRVGVDTADILIGPAGDQVFQQQISTSNQAWAQYSGQYVVPDGVTSIRIGFESVSTALGSQSVGNFIDNLQIRIAR